MSRSGDHGLHNLVLGLALLLAGIVLFFAGQRLLRRSAGPRPPVPTAQPRPEPVEDVPGMSRSIEAVTEIPPLLIQKTGKAARRRKSAVPPPPSGAKNGG